MQMQTITHVIHLPLLWKVELFLGSVVSSIHTRESVEMDHVIYG
jgi:hypothetical protein